MRETLSKPDLGQTSGLRRHEQGGQALTAQDISLELLDDLAGCVEDNVRDERLLARRIRRLRAGRAKGQSWQDLLDDEPGPGALALTTRILTRFTRVSGELRRALASGLRAQGAGIAAIAARFGVSRQRISALLRRND